MTVDLPQPALLAAALILGLLVGSFLNVVVYRLPLQLQRTWRHDALAWLQSASPAEDPQPPGAVLAVPGEALAVPGEAPPEPREPFNLVTPRSRCPSCGAGIAAFDNIPVLSWLWLRGRCRHCGAPISRRYPLVELASGLLAVLVVAHFGVTVQGAAALVLSWTLLALSLIDLDHQLLPDVITLPLLWCGLLLNVAGTFVPLADAVIGAAAGYLVLWSLYWSFRLATGREGMGYGDFKLLAALGAWFGWEALPLLLLIASFSGALYGTAAILRCRHPRRRPFAFGPFLALAGWLVLMWGEVLAAWSGLLG
ncbi:MAG: prepilin peptidase [Pseudomonadota bacterium]